MKSITLKTGIQARKGVKAIHEIVAVPDQINPSYYIINYVGGGWSIIAGDKRINPVLAYSDDAKFKTSGDIHYGLAKWLSDLHQTVKKIKSKNAVTSIPCPITAMWNQLSVPATCNGGGGGTTCVPTNTFNVVGPLVPVQWSQDCGYNGTCPNDASGPCGHDLTGCVATAMTQVMDYWQRPTRYNWPAMQPFSNDINTLMRDAGNSVSMQYGPFASSSYGEAIAPALTSTFGYSSASYDNYNFSTLISDLTANEPVILTALSGYIPEQTSCFLFWCWTTSPAQYYDGHCWIADGYQLSSTNICGSVNSSALIHMNWGWGGQSNGWYNSTSWTPSGTSFNFQYIQRMVHNIHP